MTAVEQAAAAFAPPPPGTPIEDRLIQLEEALQAVMIVLAATTDRQAQRAAAAPVRPHLYLVEN